MTTVMKNNHIKVDIGRFGSYFNKYDIGGTTFHFDTTYDGYKYLRRSGVVLDVPTEFSYHIPLNMEHKLRHIRVEQGDKVFFHADAFKYCDERNMINLTKENDTQYIMPYRFLICAIKPDDRIQMLNGRVLIKMRHDLTKSNVIIQPDPERSKNTYRYAEITHVDNNEGYSGVSNNLLNFQQFDNSKRDLQVGDIVVINKYSDFDLQSIFQEVSEHDEMKKSYVLDRSDIVCFKHQGESNFHPYGFWLNIKPVVRDYLLGGRIVQSRIRTLKTQQGDVLEVGCGISEISPNNTIRIKEKSDLLIDDLVYVHKAWVLLRGGC